MKGVLGMPNKVSVKTLDRKHRVVQQMTALGNYKPEYDDMITIYADLLDQYSVFQKQFADNGYRVSEEYTNKAGATNQRKVPVLNAIETLRKDIVTYSDRLRLNPKADIVELPPEQNQNNVLENFLQNRRDKS